MLNPINVAGPDARRKQLMQKLSQQSQQHGAMPMPPGAHGSAASLGAGLGFKAPGLRGIGGVQTTHGNNVLASILARLGVGGRAQANEVSQGLGSPISAYGPNYIPPPAQDPGNPIPAGGSSGNTNIPQDPNQAYVPPAVGKSLTPETLDPNMQMSPAPGHGFVPESPGLTAPSGPIPLGGGMYFDPNSGQIINLGGPAAGAGALPQSGQRYNV